MKFSTLVSGLAFAGFALAQDFSGLPKCAQTCATSSIPASCNLDVKCICTAQAFITSITCCVAGACDTADQQTTQQFAAALCGGVGVTNLPSAASCAATSSGPAATGGANSTAPAGAGSTITSGLSSTVAASSAVSSASGAASSAESSAAGVASSATASAATGSANTASASAASSSSSGAAVGRMVVQQGLGVLGLGVGVVAML